MSTAPTPPTAGGGWLGFDWFKLIVAILLVLLLLWFWLGAGAAPGAGSTAPTATVIAAQAGAKPAPTVVAPTVVAPTVGLPTVAAAVAAPTAPPTTPPTASPVPASPTAGVTSPAAPTAATRPAPLGPTLALTAGAVLTTSPVVLTGSGPPGSEVEILDNGLVIGRATVGADGRWSVTTVPGAGKHSYSVRPVGNAAGATPPVEVTVDGAAAGPLQITGPATGSTINATEVTLVGIAPPNSEIELVDKGYPIGRLAIGADGRWNWTARPLTGPHRYIARLTSDPRTVSNQVNITSP